MVLLCLLKGGLGDFASFWYGDLEQHTFNSFNCVYGFFTLAFSLILNADGNAPGRPAGLLSSVELATGEREMT